MNPKQKVLFAQLQIASVGLLIGIFGLLWSNHLLLLFGVSVMVYGLIRAWLLARLMKDAQGEADPDLDLDAIIREAKRKEKEEHPDRFDDDEEEDDRVR